MGIKDQIFVELCQDSNNCVSQVESQSIIIIYLTLPCQVTREGTGTGDGEY